MSPHLDRDAVLARIAKLGELLEQLRAEIASGLDGPKAEADDAPVTDEERATIRQKLRRMGVGG